MSLEVKLRLLKIGRVEMSREKLSTKLRPIWASVVDNASEQMSLKIVTKGGINEKGRIRLKTRKVKLNGAMIGRATPILDQILSMEKLLNFAMKRRAFQLDHEPESGVGIVEQSPVHRRSAMTQLEKLRSLQIRHQSLACVFSTEDDVLSSPAEEASHHHQRFDQMIANQQEIVIHFGCLDD